MKQTNVKLLCLFASPDYVHIPNHFQCDYVARKPRKLVLKLCFHKAQHSSVPTILLKRLGEKIH